MNSPRATSFNVGIGLGAALLASCGSGEGYFVYASLTISVSPTTITLGQSATISWDSEAPCTASGAWSGSRAASGSETVSPTQTGSLVYTLVCKGNGFGPSKAKSATLTVNPAPLGGLWIGHACCVESSDFEVAGVTGDNGDYRFLLLGAHYVGKAGAMPKAYATCDTGLAGSRLDDVNAFRILDVSPRVSVFASVRAPSEDPGSTMLAISLPYDPASNRGSKLVDLVGSYTTYLGTGYTLTITIDAAGMISGVDTDGCNLLGRASAGGIGANNFKVALDVSDCGAHGGRYDGVAALTYYGSSRPTGLFLSAANDDAAIGWRLSR